MAIPEKGNIMTKGTAQQLRDGAERLDQAKRDIFATIKIIKGYFEKPPAWERGEGIDLITKPVNGRSYRWIIHLGLCESGVVCIECALQVNMPEYGVVSHKLLHDSSAIKSPPMEHVLGIHDSLDEFVDALFAKFPEMKTRFHPLLDAGV
jgi:hypothetical protein